MGCNCKSNKLIEERVSKQFNTDFTFGEKGNKNITKRVLFLFFQLIFGVILFPLLIVCSFIYKKLGKRIVINLSKIIKKENRVIVNE